jgi:hypothetical protein
MAGARVYWVPIRHTAVDLGSQAEQLRTPAERLTAWWHRLTERVLALPLAWPQVRIYQDSLPVCAFTTTIVRDLANQGSPNYQLVQSLLERGAHLEGTEDPELLKRELALAHTPDLAEAARLVLARDAFIAQRLVITLQAHETALLFLGAAHRPLAHLPVDWTSTIVN